MTTQYRKGSEGAADTKMVNYFRIGMTIALVLALILLWTVPLLKQEAAQTGTGYKLFSWICFIGCVLVIALASRITKATASATLFFVMWFALYGLGIFLRICGGV